MPDAGDERNGDPAALGDLGFGARRGRALVAVVAALITVIGDQVAAVALAFRLAPTGGIWIGLLFIVLIAPVVLLGPVAGLLADHRSPRAVIGGSLALQGLIAIALIGARTPAAIVGLSLALALAGAAVQPAAFSVLPRLVRSGKLREVNAVAEATRSCSALIGPVVGGAIVTTSGTASAIRLDAVSFGVAAIAATLVLPGVAATRSSARVGGLRRSAAAAGVRALSVDPLLRRVLSVLLVTVAASSMATVSLVFFVTRVLHNGPGPYGLLVSAWGLGMVGAPLVLVHARPNRLDRMPLLAAGLTGAMILLVGISANLPIAVVAFLGGGGANAIQNVCMRNLMHSRVDRSLHGRAYGAYLAAMNGAVVVGFIAGGVAGPANSRVVYIVGGGVALIAAACGLRAFRRSVNIGVVTYRPWFSPTGRAEAVATGAGHLEHESPLVPQGSAADL